MTTRLEATSSPEIDTRQHGMEILTPKSYGIAGRLLVASAAEASDLHLILNPAEDIKTTLVPSLTTKLEDPTITRDFSKITQRLSTSERAAAWDGTTDLDAALTEWVRGFTTYATHTTKEGRKNAISGLAGKEAASLTEDDSRVLYETFCKDNESNTGEYVNATIGRLKGPDGKVDVAKLQAEIDDIQWLASRFFGVETAKAVAELVKLEAELVNNKPNTINVLLKDPATSRIDDFYKEEEELLIKLLGEPVYTRDTAATPPASATAQPTTPPPFPPAPWPTPVTTAPSEPNPVAPVLPATPWEVTPPTDQPITEAQLQEAKSSAVGKEIEKYLAELTVLMERGHNNQELEDDAEQRKILLEELDSRVGNKGVVTDALAKINRLYKSLSEGRLTPEYHANRDEFLDQHPEFKSLDEDARQEEAKLYVAAYANSPSTPTEPVADSAPTAPETAPISGDIVAQVLSPDNITPDGQSYILPKELLTHEGLDFSQTALNPQLRELIKSLSERLINPSFPKEVKLSQSFSAEELQEVDPQWQGLDLRILLQSDFDANDTISLSAKMKHASIPEATEQSSIRQRYKDLEAYLEKTLGKELRIGGSMDRDYNPLSIDISWVGDKIHDMLVLSLSPDGMSISITMDEPGRVASSVRDDLIGNTGEIALQRFFSVFSALTPLMRQPVSEDITPELGPSLPIPTDAPEPVIAPPPAELATAPEAVDAAEPPIAPPAVRTERQILNDIARESTPNHQTELAQKELAQVNLDIQQINNGSFKSPDGKELPESVLKTFLENRLERKAELELQLAASADPLFAHQDEELTETQPVPQEDEPALPRIDQPEEVLTPLPDAPEPPLFTTQDAATADEPRQPVIEQEEQPSGRNPFSWVTEGFKRGNSGQN